MHALSGRHLRPWSLRAPPFLLVALLVWADTATARPPTTVISFGPRPESIVDTDADGMSDAWELRNGLDPASPADAALDLDGDGVSALLEFRQGSDPWSADTNRDGTADGQAPDAGVTMVGDSGNQAALQVFRPGA
jgi:hypothetical protein